MAFLLTNFFKKYKNKQIKCKTNKCPHKKYLDDKCIYCYNVYYISIINKDNIIINKKECPYCIKSVLKNSYEKIDNINADCCENHILYFEQIKNKIKITYV